VSDELARRGSGFQLANLDLNRELPLLFSLAEALLPTGFLPIALQTSGQVVAVLLAGRELGLAPMTALRTINIVEGKVGIAASLQLALANRAGIKHRFIEQTAERCVLELQSPGEEPMRYEYTIAEAKAALLIERGRARDENKRAIAGTSVWEKHPKNMLRARCISNAISAHCPEVLLAVYDPDEIEDIRETQLAAQGLAAPYTAPEHVVEVIDAETGEVTQQAVPPQTNTAPASAPVVESTVVTEPENAAQRVLQDMAGQTPPPRPTKKAYQPKIPFGNKKGQPLANATDDELKKFRDWYIGLIKDPEKADKKRWNERDLQAIREEWTRRHPKQQTNEAAAE
jgi:hypothetical protein